MPASSASKISVTNPFTQHKIADLAVVTDDQLEQMVRRLSNLHRQGPPPYYARKKLLQNFLHLMEQHKGKLVSRAIAEGGKPFKDSMVEVERALEGIQVGIESIYRLSGSGEGVPMGINERSAHHLAYTYRRPVGLVLAVTAFNHPINLVIHHLVSAIVAGCPLLLKPAKKTPLSCQLIFELLEASRHDLPLIPEGYCQWILCSRGQLLRLVQDPRIALICFIGGADVGWMLRSEAAPGSRVNLEHGGTATLIIGERNNPEPTAEMVEQILKGAFYHAGQVCVSTQSIYLPKKLKAIYVEALVKEIKKMRVGDPTDPRTDLGPMISAEAVKRADDFVQLHHAQGAKIAVGGKRIATSGADSNCYAPTLLVYPDGAVMEDKEELFAPILCLYSYEEGKMADLITRLNRSRFSFQAAIFTDQIDEMLYVAAHLDQKTILVNDHTAFRVDWMPFGGLKASGLGRSGIPYTVEEMTNEHLLVIKRGAMA